MAWETELKVLQTEQTRKMVVEKLDYFTLVKLGRDVSDALSRAKQKEVIHIASLLNDALQLAKKYDLNIVIDKTNFTTINQVTVH